MSKAGILFSSIIGFIAFCGYLDYQDFANHRGNYAPEKIAAATDLYKNRESERESEKEELRQHLALRREQWRADEYKSCLWWRDAKMDWGILPGPPCSP